MPLRASIWLSVSHCRSTALTCVAICKIRAATNRMLKCKIFKFSTRFYLLCFNVHHGSLQSQHAWPCLGRALRCYRLDWVIPTYELALRYNHLQVSLSCMFALTTGTVSLTRAISSCLIHPLTAVPVADRTCAALRLTLAARLGGWPSRSDGLGQSLSPCDWPRPAEWRNERTATNCTTEEGCRAGLPSLVPRLTRATKTISLGTRLPTTRAGELQRSASTYPRHHRRNLRPPRHWGVGCNRWRTADLRRSSSVEVTLRLRVPCKLPACQLAALPGLSWRPLSKYGCVVIFRERFILCSMFPSW